MNHVLSSQYESIFKDHDCTARQENPEQMSILDVLSLKRKPGPIVTDTGKSTTRYSVQEPLNVVEKMNENKKDIKYFQKYLNDSRQITRIIVSKIKRTFHDLYGKGYVNSMSLIQAKMIYKAVKGLMWII